MIKLSQYNLTELTLEDSSTINGGSPFFRDLGASVGMLVGWVKNAGENIIYEIRNTKPGYDMSGMNQLMLFQ
jgi:uncharacterized protein (DUF433 family)